MINYEIISTGSKGVEKKEKCAHCAFYKGVKKYQLVEAVKANFIAFAGGGGMKCRTILTEEQEFQIFDEYEEGITNNTIAKKIGVSWGVVARFLNKITAERQVQTQEEYEKKVPIDTIAKKFGISPALVARFVKMC